MPNRTSLCSIAQPPLCCPHWPPSSPTCQSQGGVWRLVKTGLPDSTQLRPAWPILWYLTTRLQDTCSFELKCHWGILSAHRHLSLTSDFTLVCYKPENTGPWPWCAQTLRQQRYMLLTYWPSHRKRNNTRSKPSKCLDCIWPFCKRYMYCVCNLNWIAVFSSKSLGLKY